MSSIRIHVPEDGSQHPRGASGISRNGGLVSCIMPTHNRRAFVGKGIEYFLRQDYGPRELVIVDDGTDSIRDLMPDDARIRYHRLPQKISLGAKRNYACQQARGDLIIHWDDDDWFAAWRVGYQVEQLLEARADLCGLDTLLFYAPDTQQAWKYAYPRGRTPWVAGGTLCYTRAFWQANPFPEINVGEDARFVWAPRAKKMRVLPDPRFYVALIHAGNTSRKQTRGAWWQPHSLADLEEVMGEDWKLYATTALASNVNSPRVSRGPNHRAQDLPRSPGTCYLSRTNGRHDMKLNLGCCDAPLDGYVNVDLIEGPGVQCADLRQPWPWQDNSVDFVRAWDIIEHLPDKIFTMNELWRVLKPAARAEIAVPTTDGSGAFQDPTHVSFWNRRSFLYFEHGNIYRERFARHYGIRAKFRTVSERTERTVDGPKLTIVLEAVK